MKIRDFLDETVVYRGIGHSVHRDPTRAQATAMMASAAKKGDHVRGMIARDGHLYAWNGYYATHDDISRLLALGNQYLPFEMHPDGVKFDLPKGGMRDGEVDEMKAKIEACKPLWHIYRTKPPIKIEWW